jgi:hypothetical protein
MSDPAIELFLNWRFIPSGIGWQDEVARTGPETGDLRLSVMPSFHFEPADPNATPPVSIAQQYLDPFIAWPDTLGHMQFDLYVALVSQVSSSTESTVLGQKIPLDWWPAPTRQSIATGRAILAATLGRKLITRTPHDQSCNQMMRAGAAKARRFRVRGYDDMPHPKRVGSSLHEAYERRTGALFGRLSSGLMGQSAPPGTEVIAPTPMSREQSNDIYQPSRIFFAANAPYADRLDSRNITKFLQSQFTTDSALLAKCQQEIGRLADSDDWASRLYAEAILGASLTCLDPIARSSYPGLPQGTGDLCIEETLDTLVQGTLTTAVAAAAFHVYEPYMKLALAQWNTLTDNNPQNSKATAWAYLNLLRYHIATHPECLTCDNTQGGKAQDDINDVDNLLAGLTSWPAIARVTGLCFDLKVDGGALLAALTTLDASLKGPFALRVLPRDALPQTYPAAAHEVHCWTVFNWISGTPEQNFWPLPKPSSSEIVAGTLNLPNNYQLRNVDVDADTHHATRQAQNAAIAEGDGLAAKDTEVLHKGTVECGLTLVANAAGDEANDSQDDVTAQNQSICGKQPVVLYAEDLTAGYRIDVRHCTGDTDDSGRWLSICERAVAYRLTLGGLALEQLPIDKAREEGLVHKIARRLKGATENPDEISPNNVLCQWRDHNVAVRDSIDPAGDPFTDSGAAPNINDFLQQGGFPFRIDTAVPPHSQPRLRKEDRYFMAGRVVFANGSSLGRAAAARIYDLKVNDSFAGTRLGDGGKGDTAYQMQRCEPILPPDLHLTEPIEGRRFPGDEIECIVVRSASDFPDNSHSERWIVAPPVSIESAEMEGALDALNQLPKGALREFKLDPCGAVPSVRELFPGRCKDGKDKDPHCGDTILVRGRNGRPAVPYYPDPSAKALQLALVAESAGTCAYQRSKISWYTKDQAWPDAPAIRLRVSRTSAGPVALRAQGQVLPRTSRPNASPPTEIEIQLPPGEITYLSTWSSSSEGTTIQEPHFEDLIQAVQDNPRLASDPGLFIRAIRARTTLRPSGVSGDVALPTINPRRIVKLVHAVQRPLRAPRFAQDFGARRFLSSTGTAGVSVPPGPTPWDRAATRVGAPQNAALLEGKIELDRRTTGRVDITSERYDWIDEPNAKAGPCRQHILDTLPHLEPIDPTAPEDAVSLQIDDTGAERNIWHDLKDTKHHHIAYRLTASSAFRNYFQDGNKTDSDGRFTVSSESVEPGGRRVHILSTQRPNVPVLASMFPTFKHEASLSPGLARLRRRAGLKLWLDRPWFSSGNDEKLAVLCGPSNLLSKRSEPTASPAEPRTNRWVSEDLDQSDLPNTSLLPFVSQIGLDPTVPYGELVEVLPAGAFLDPRMPDGRCKTDSNLAIAGSDGPDHPELCCSAVLFDVGVEDYDCERRQYGINVGIDLDALAWVPANRAFRPFIRLVLARYQAYSVESLQLSRPLVADMCQLQPNRSLQITYDPDHADLIDVRIFEYGPAEKCMLDSTVAADKPAYDVQIELLKREGSHEHPRWLSVTQQTARIEKVGGEFLARARFVIDSDDLGKQHAIRVREHVIYLYNTMSTADSGDQLAGDSSIKQPVLFMLQPVHDHGERETV